MNATKMRLLGVVTPNASRAMDGLPQVTEWFTERPRPRDGGQEEKRPEADAAGAWPEWGPHRHRRRRRNALQGTPCTSWTEQARGRASPRDGQRFRKDAWALRRSA